MDQKANIIKSLKRMGYIVSEFGGIVHIHLKLDSHYMTTYSVSEEELMYGDFIVEHIVFKINESIKRDN
jgi:hypothetical protein